MARLTDPKTGLILTSLTPDIIPKCYEYIYDVKAGNAKGEVIPTLAGLALFLGVTRKTLLNWEKQQQDNESYGEIMEAFDMLDTNQEVITVNGGLTGVFNPGLVKIIMGKYGYVEVNKVDNTSSDGSMTPVANARDLSDAELEAIISKDEPKA
jgi:hypothetical protein